MVPDRPDEKRRSTRQPFVLKVDYADRAGCADATENLSHGGMFIQTETQFAVGERVPLSLSFPGLLDPIEIVGRVAWIRRGTPDQPGGVGVCCDRVSDRQKLEGLLTSLSAERSSLSDVAAPPGGFRVLLVEDNPHIVEMYSYVLKKLAAGDLKGKVPLEVQFAVD